MNARLLEQFILYRKKHGLLTARMLISQKIFYQYSIIHHVEWAKPFIVEINGHTDVENMMLTEARAAKMYWNKYAMLLGKNAVWHGRKSHAPDPLNKLLDIGYHYVVGYLISVCTHVSLPTEIGIFHIAQSARATPFIYDYMEWLRPILVDKIVLTMIHKKKKIFENVSTTDIKRLIYLIKQELQTCFYDKKLKYCITLEYWITLHILSLQKAVRIKKEWVPLFPSLRHESRCRQCQNKTAPDIRAV